MAWCTQCAPSCSRRSLLGSLAKSLERSPFASAPQPHLDLLAAMLLLSGLLLKEACGVAGLSEELLVGAFLLVARSLFTSAPFRSAAAGCAAPHGARAAPRRPAPATGRQAKSRPRGRDRLEPGPARGLDPSAAGGGAARRYDPLGAQVARGSSRTDSAAGTRPRAPACPSPAVAKPVHSRCRGLRGECSWLVAEALESGAAADLSFFKRVAGSLGEAALRESAADLLQAMREQGLVVDWGIQMQLSQPFNGSLPDDLMEGFWALREQDCGLCWTVLRSLMVGYERKAPERTLELYEGIKSSGLKPDLLVCNAVLCALAQGARASEALQLFQQMCPDDGASNIGTSPNGKSYGSVIRACTAGGRNKVAVALFDCMVTKGIKPNRFAYHDAILSLMRLKKIRRAWNLYLSMKRDGVPPCDNTLRLLIRTCAMRGWHEEAASISEHFRSAKRAEAQVESEAATEFRESSAEGESE
ncbi:unnamed protein product [Prorocentrum cordatum]|uniref:PROP1-like PPR domain-containing protein n=1 Tax=Prorocentrum cordatum TaxID=2364126 RepID=A0ABN9XJ23_9DINO|nr:unnamed protein product [Polarella glacialis]